MDKLNDTSIPPQLDDAFFLSALQCALREHRLEIKQIKLLSASGNADKYNSGQLYRVLIIYSKIGQLDTDAISFAVKLMPSYEGLDIPDAIEVFNKEKWLYIDILPKMETLFNDVQFAPSLYYSANNPFQVLVLDDIERFGFQIGNRKTGLDERHAKLALKKLGQFHAASMVVAEKDPIPFISCYDRGLLDSRAVNSSTSFYKMLFKHLSCESKLASQWEDFEEIKIKLQEFLKDFEVRLLECQKPKKREIKVLNHGDFSVNNLLFIYDSRNNPVDLVFLDFQFSIWGSPGIDLNYFLFAGVEFEVQKLWKTLLEVYHASLRDTLVRLFYRKMIPTYDDIESEFKQKAPYGFFTLFGTLPIVTMEGNDFEKLAESFTETKAIFRSKKLIERLKYSLLELDKMGAF